MTFWKKHRREAHDRHREFIYLDEVSVVSLLAGLQGEIKESVTGTLTRAKDADLKTSVGAPMGTAGAESRFGSTRTSTSEVVRRAVVQSTFRDLWRRDVGVLLHDTSGIKQRHRKPLRSFSELENAIPRLKKSKLAVALADIRRGDLLEMDGQVEADQFFKMVTVGTTFLELMDGREGLFGVSANELRQVAPAIEVLKELSVGLVPMRGRSTSHCIVHVMDEPLVIARELLAGDLANSARPLELVGFAETDSFWRDLRRTLFSGSTFTIYARAEGPALEVPWSPIKLADLLESVSPKLRDEVAKPLKLLDFETSADSNLSDADAVARFQLSGFSRELQAGADTSPNANLVAEAVEAAIPALAAAQTLDERRRAFEPVADAVAGPGVDRDVLLAARSAWLDRTPEGPEGAERVATDSAAPPPPDPPVQLEVGFVALYW